MFPIYLADRKKMNPADDICYIVAKNGLFLKKKLGIIESLTPVNEVSDLKHSVTPYARMNLPKIPKSIFCSVFTLFRKVYEEYRSECVVLLFYNERNKKFKVGVPYQKVSFTGAECVKMGSPEGYITVASIHSHCSFSAFHSGTDIADEEYIEGLHVTIGEVDEEQFSMVASIVSNRKRFKVDPLDFINGIDECKGIVGGKLKYLVTGGFNKEYDPEWLKFITGTKYEPVDYNFSPLFYNIRGYDGFKNYEQYFKDREKKHTKGEETAEAKEVNDPCKICPFRKDKEPETRVVDLFFEGY